MPGTAGRSAAAIVAAVRSGRLAEADLDAAAARVLALVARAQPALAEPGTADLDAHHELAREAAAAGSVLLANAPVDGAPLLPLASGARLAVVGELARSPRYQGAGSSQVTPTQLDDLLTALGERLGAHVPFAPGYTVDGGDADAALREDAARVASGADVVVVFLGLPAAAESEGYDRTHLDLPANQVAALEAVAAANPRVVVVLANGGVVTMPWAHHAPAILETWLGGQAAGSAIADVLLGLREPGGRLAETIPHRLVDTPSFGAFPGDPGRPGSGTARACWSGTGGTTPARWMWRSRSAMGWATRGSSSPLPPRRSTGAGRDVEVRVAVRVTNTGTRTGSEVVQVYVADPESQVTRPTRELKGFAKVRLEPGESREVTVTLGARDLSYWHPGLRRWVVEGGAFRIEVGASSRDLSGSVEVQVDGEPLWLPLDEDSTLGEWRVHPVGGPLVERALAAGPAVDAGLAA